METKKTRAEYQKEYYAKNRLRCLEINKKWRAKHRTYILVLNNLGRAKKRIKELEKQIFNLQTLALDREEDKYNNLY